MDERAGKKAVWADIVRLIQPYRRPLLIVFFLSLMATGMNLLSPLIYREAINDISGLFVTPSPVPAGSDSTAQGLEGEAPELPFLDRFLKSRTPVPADSVYYTYDTLHIVKDSIVFRKVRHNRSRLKAAGQPTGQHRRVQETKIVREPHTTSHVAARTPRQALETLAWAVILLFVINLLGLVLWWIGENVNVRIACGIERQFLKKAFGHVLRLPLSFFSTRSTAALHKQIDQSEEISGIVSTFTKSILPEIISLAGILIIMFWQNYVLALLSVSVIPFYILITIRSTKKLETSLTGYYEKWEMVSGVIQDSLSGIKTVKLSGAEDREINNLDGYTKTAYRDYLSRSFLSNRYSFWQILLTHLATAIVLTYGGWLALQHRLTPGDVVMFVAYLDMLYEPIDNLAGIWAEVQQNITSISRAFRLLDVQTEERQGDPLQSGPGGIEFRDVDFSYANGREVLHALSFSAAPGKMTALVGKSGAGKTTTIDLMLKLFEPQGGEIFVNGQPLSKLDGASVRRQIGVVSADGAIFRGTLADNIRYKKPEATIEEVSAAALAAGMETTLGRMPEGLNTTVGENGVGLSVGERQRIQIARVLVARPSILVLDEATANLDFATEAEIRKTLDGIRKDSTVIVIAHRYSMVSEADVVYVLQEGRVTETGSPAALIAAGGWFSRFAAGGVSVSDGEATEAGPGEESNAAHDDEESEEQTEEQSEEEESQEDESGAGEPAEGG